FQQHPERLMGELPAQFIERTIDRLNLLLGQYEQRRGQLQRRIELYQWLAGRLGKEVDPSDRSNNSRLIEMMVALELSDGGGGGAGRVGPMYWGQFQRTTSISQIQTYREWFTRQQREFTQGKGAAWWGGIEENVDV